MENFVLESPTKIIFGRDTLPLLGQETIALGHKALLVYGRQSLKRNNLHQRICGYLQESGVEIIEHGGGTSNPLLSHVRQGIELAKKHAVEVIIAAGGGSVIDSAKAIAAGAVVKHDVWKFFTAKKGITTPLPVGCVLTLAASGSEMNGGMVLTNDEKHLKLGAGNKKICPRFSILDPTLTFSVPADYTAYGAVDAIAHILEAYFNASGCNTAIQDRLMEGLVINIMEACEAALITPDNYEARANLMWGATLALNGWARAGLGITGFPMHLIEHTMSALFNIPHGAGLAVVVPAWMEWRLAQKPEKFAQFAARIFNITEGGVTERARQGLQHLRAWISRAGCPLTLKELGISADDISELAANAQPQAKIWRLPEYNSDTISEILHLCQ